MAYTIFRDFLDEEEEQEIVEENVTLEHARKHCGSIEASSHTCTLPENIARTVERGPWFDGYREE